jgi:hypothetical protein
MAISRSNNDQISPEKVMSVGAESKLPGRRLFSLFLLRFINFYRRRSLLLVVKAAYAGEFCCSSREREASKLAFFEFLPAFAGVR